MHILITGAGGMLAKAMTPALEGSGHRVTPFSRAELDITDHRSVEAELKAHRPDVVVQCAAFTAVDAAEERPAEAFAVNAEGTFNVARACQRIGAMFVYPSTDYVFRGTSKRPYRVDDPVDPVNSYGRSKAAGEEAAREADRYLVVRTSWLYGAGGANFVDTMSRLGRERESLSVVDDQVGRPTWTATLADAIADLLERGTTGIAHCTDVGDPVSWYGFARETLRLQGIETPVEPVGSEAFPRPAPRPAYSVLDCTETEAILGRPLPRWEEALRRYLQQRGVPAEEGVARGRA